MKDSTNNNLKNIALSGMFIALGIVLPIAFHSVPDAGKVFLPMFIPVLLGSLFLPWHYAMAVGIITPLLSSLLTGMPPMVPLPMAVMMMAELGVAALVLSLLKNIKWLTSKKYLIDIALIPALIIGKIASALVLMAAIQFFAVKGPGMWVYITGAFISGIPGIAIQLVLLPVIYSLIKRRRTA
ncbi:MAG: ECF transporter S component [Eubacteriales bacterium]